MKFVALGLILICCNIWTVKTNVINKFGNKLLEDFLEKFKTILRTGNSTLGIPVLDPFNADQLEIKLNEEAINLNALLTKVNVNGLSGYDIINADYSIDISHQIVVLTLHLSWPLVAATTEYSIKGKVDDFEIYGNGEIRMSAQTFAFDTTIDFTLDDGITGYLKVKEIKLKLSLNALDFHATGLYNDEEVSEILSAIISDMAPELIGDDKIVYEIVQVIRKPLDDFLATKTLLEILKMIL